MFVFNTDDYTCYNICNVRFLILEYQLVYFEAIQTTVN